MSDTEREVSDIFLDHLEERNEIRSSELREKDIALIKRAIEIVDRGDDAVRAINIFSLSEEQLQKVGFESEEHAEKLKNKWQECGEEIMLHICEWLNGLISTQELLERLERFDLG